MNEGMTFQFPSLGIRHPEVINYRALGTAGRGGLAVANCFSSEQEQ